MLIFVRKLCSHNRKKIYARMSGQKTRSGLIYLDVSVNFQKLFIFNRFS